MEVTSAQVCEDLIALMGRAKAGILGLANDIDLTPVQLFTLYAILKGEGHMGRIACKLHCDASNVTGIADRLVTRGLVVRQEDPGDRRVKTLQLTPSGNDLMQHVMDKLPGYLGCDKLSGEERAALHAAVCKLTA